VTNASLPLSVTLTVDPAVCCMHQKFKITWYHVVNQWYGEEIIMIIITKKDYDEKD